MSAALVDAQDAPLRFLLTRSRPQARRGYYRDHRPDCKQVCIALVVTFDGFPLGYEVFAGNTHDSRTLQTIVGAMEARHGALGRVWIADRAMDGPQRARALGSRGADNLAWLRATGRRYIIGAPKSELKKFAFALAAHSGDLERSIRSIMNTGSGDHERLFALA